MNTSQTGYLTKEELNENVDILKAVMPVVLDPERWEDIFSEIDINQNGYVDLNEFIMACSIFTTEDLQPANQQNVVDDDYY